MGAAASTTEGPSFTAVGLRKASDAELKELVAGLSEEAKKKLSVASKPKHEAAAAPQHNAIASKPKHAGIAHLKKLDEELIAEVAAGAIAFLVGDFVRSGKLKLSATRQELEERQARTGDKIFLTPEEAAALLQDGDREVGALTYGWSSPDHPDPDGHYMRAVIRFLRSPHGAHIVTIFWDQMSLHQWPRDAAQQQSTHFGLHVALYVCVISPARRFEI